MICLLEATVWVCGCRIRSRRLQQDPRYAIRLLGGASFDAASGINTLEGTILVAP